MLKKTLLMLLAMMVVFSACLLLPGYFQSASHAESDAPEPTMRGTVLELGSGSFLMMNDENVLICVDYLHCQTFDTDLPLPLGHVTPLPLQPGDVIEVGYNGFISRDIPSRISAEWIRSHRIDGTVTKLMDDGFLMSVDSSASYHIICKCDVPVGSSVTVWYDGSIQGHDIAAWQTDCTESENH